MNEPITLKLESVYSEDGSLLYITVVPDEHTPHNNPPPMDKQDYE